MLDALIILRTVHFAASILVAGTLIFSAAIAEPVLQKSDCDRPAWLRTYQRHLAVVATLALTMAILSGVVHLVAIAAAVSEEPWAVVIRDGTAWAFFTDTHFGKIAQLRLLLAAGLALLLLRWAIQPRLATSGLRKLAAVLAAILLGSLALTGHAAGATGIGATLHLGADLAHVLAAGAWLGGLLPLALFVRHASQSADISSLAMCARILRRFSTLGVASVATLFVTGVINTWYLTDRLSGLLGTEYGKLVQIKIGLFLAMLCLAAINRFWLTPSTIDGHGSTTGPHAQQAMRWLRVTVAAEIALGLAVLYLVGLLGTTAPAGHHHACNFRLLGLSSHGG